MNTTKQFRAMFSAQLKIMFREKQVWFWNIFFPVILMVLFMIIFGGGGSSSFSARIAVVDAVPNASSAMLIEQMNNIPVFEFKDDQPVSLEQGETWIADGDIDALIIMPEVEGVSTVQLLVNREDEQSATSQAVSGILSQFLQQTNLAVAGVTPTYTLKFDSITTASEDTDYQDFLLTGMIGLSIAQGGLFGMVGLVDMRKKGLLRRLQMTPARMGIFGLAGMIVRLMLAVIQIIVLCIIGVYGFGAHLQINVFTLLIAFLAGAMVFNAMGYLFSSFSKTMEAYMGMANIASMLMMFLSGVFFPIHTLPEWLQIVPKILPLTYFVEGMRNGLIYAESIFSETFWMGMGVMALWGIVCFLVAAKLYKSQSISIDR